MSKINTYIQSQFVNIVLMAKEADMIDQADVRVLNDAFRKCVLEMPARRQKELIKMVEEAKEEIKKTEVKLQGVDK